jgi:hypothetical protein
MSGVPVGAVLAPGVPWWERRIVTPLGIRFRDIALGEPITHGLVVFVQPRESDSGPIRLSSNPSGVFGFHDMPGLRDLEYPAEVEPAAGSPPTALPFVVMVADPLGRFLPAVFGIEIPALVTSPPLSDLDPDPAPMLDAFLFTAPTRPVTAGLAAIRADLFDRDADTPAAHARVRVTLGDRLRIGVADERGRLLVLVPWPLLERLRLGSPPGLGQPPTTEQVFPLSFEAWYQPDLPRPFASEAVLPAPWTVLPGLKGILEHADRAAIWPSPAGPPVVTLTSDLAYERGLVLRTVSVSELWISRGASPP